MKKRLLELLDGFRELDDTNDGRSWTEHLADYLMENRVIAPPVSVGQVIYSLIRVDDHWYIEKETVTAIGADKFFFSTIVPADMTDAGDFFYYKAFGIDIFLTREEAEQAIVERSRQ